jgi:hypothetical protein
MDDSKTVNAELRVQLAHTAWRMTMPLAGSCMYWALNPWRKWNRNAKWGVHELTPAEIPSLSCRGNQISQNSWVRLRTIQHYLTAPGSIDGDGVRDRVKMEGNGNAVQNNEQD